MQRMKLLNNNLTKIKSTKRSTKIITGIILALIIVCIFCEFFMFPYLRIRLSGIYLEPSQDIPLYQITYYLQNDDQWRDDIIGKSSTTLGREGCLVSCVSSAVSHLENETVTPQELNQKLTQVEGYENASLLWYKIGEIYPSLDYRSNRVFSSETIESDLKNGLLPIVKVKMNGIGAIHWVTIVGAENGQFMISDPLNRDKKPIPLSKHGKVYSYRIITKIL